MRWPSFLDNMQEHIDKLPDKEELKELRETAQKFVKDVRGSGASEAMAAAESALAEFAPTRGHKKAQEAADILKKFLKECNELRQLRLQGAEVSADSVQRARQYDRPTAGRDGHGRRHGRRQRMDGFGPTGLYGGLPRDVGEIPAKRPAAAKATPAEKAARRSAKSRRSAAGRTVRPRRRRRRQRSRRAGPLSTPGGPILPTRRRGDRRERAIERCRKDTRCKEDDDDEHIDMPDSSFIIHHSSFAARRAAGGVAGGRWLGPRPTPGSRAASPTASSRWPIWSTRARRAAAASPITSSSRPKRKPASPPAGGSMP